MSSAEDTPVAEAQGTHQHDAAPAPAEPAGKLVPAPKTAAAAARRRAGHSSGGKHMRNAALIGLGDELPTNSLRTADDQLRVLEATLVAVAKGRTSGMVAQTILALVKAANQVLVTDQGQAIAVLEAKLDQLVVEAGPRVGRR